MRAESRFKEGRGRGPGGTGNDGFPGRASRMERTPLLARKRMALRIGGLVDPQMGWPPVGPWSRCQRGAFNRAARISLLLPLPLTPWRWCPLPEACRASPWLPRAEALFHRQHPGTRPPGPRAAVVSQARNIRCDWSCSTASHTQNVPAGGLRPQIGRTARRVTHSRVGDGDPIGKPLRVDRRPRRRR